ncbi:protein of unknown function [Methylorubrum extorquens]|uniref:Uncharacterized protein n=1 Tax=Methylorubrum extorquens TaxID=408 RepID=A0A2N9AKL7_METEX|nr:protein of unknown function [Methylorubrum extorquens]
MTVRATSCPSPQTLVPRAADVAQAIVGTGRCAKGRSQPKKPGAKIS